VSLGSGSGIPTNAGSLRRVEVVIREGRCVGNPVHPFGGSCSGGGYGPPADRDPGLVAKDVVDGVISLGRARDVYGVVYDQLGAIDPAATGELRHALTTAGT
jgi:N-methylhydantoinase B/oxoprolinase/acetone carboxylase alpha subunit